MKDDYGKNKLLFDNLIERLMPEGSGDRYSLPGVITADEYSALLVAQEKMGFSDVIENHNEAELDSTHLSNASSPTDEVKDEVVQTHLDYSSSDADLLIVERSSNWIANALDLSVLAAPEFLTDIKLGLDFGTAYSKACMIKVEGDDEQIFDLPLGIYAGEDALEMPVHSSLFIDPDGRLYFGPIAVEKSLEARANGEQASRIDSIKSFLIDEDRVTIDDSPLEKIFNPTDFDVSKAALLTFFLGYLLNLVREVAAERHNIDIKEVQQRISLPCYEGDHRAKVVREISTLFAYGEVLSKSFQSEWEDGFEMQVVVDLYEWMRVNVNDSSPYIESFLEEPLAVAGSRLSLNGNSLGNVCMVVDVGAGTTDFTMFQIFANSKKDNIVATEVKNSGYGLPIAGDKLDKILLAYILREAGISRSSENYKEILLSLRLDIRHYKERLFTANTLTYSLPSGITGVVTLSEFLQEKSVRDFTLDLKQAFVHVLESIHPSWIKTKIRNKNAQSKLPVILTGGGADLPMVKNLSKGIIEAAGYAIELFASPIVPKWIDDNYEGEIINLYPQLAVAIGGAKQFIIERTGVQKVFE
jgi:molecular chaperone HscA